MRPYICLVSKPQNIILIVADSLRYDSMHLGTAPGLSYAESHGTKFTEARSAGCWTLPATASLFTGLMPHEHGATSQTRKLSENAPTLAERLQLDGFKTYQVTANVVTTEIFGLDRGFDEVHKIWGMVQPKFKKTLRFAVLAGKPRVRKMLMSKDGLVNELSEDLTVGNCWVQNTFEDSFEVARKILQRNEQKNARSFIFINMMESHFPYHIGPTFKLSQKGLKNKTKEIKGLYHLLNQSFLKKDKEYIQPKIAEVIQKRQHESWKILQQKLDEYIQELHEDKNNLVVFCSDHGDNFGDQEWYYHFSNVTDAGNKVPLFWMDNESKTSRVIHTPVSSRFIQNSILKKCGLEHANGTLFDDEQFTLPIMQSYWYDNNGKTMDKFIYNQFCFVQDKMRYVYKNGNWSAARITENSIEPKFEPLPTGVDPIQETVSDLERKSFLIKSLAEFNSFQKDLLP